MDKSVLCVILIGVLCNYVDLRQVDFENIFEGNNNQEATRPSGVTTTTPSPQFANCVANCLQYVTRQYNPVCGTDGQNYYNPKYLGCSQRCGLNVTVHSGGTCASSLSF